MDVCLPYYERTLTSQLQLDLHLMNNEIRKNLLDKLRTQKQGCCNRYGYVAYVKGLVDISGAEIRPEDIQARPVFYLSYNCVLCIPNDGDVIIGRVKRASDSIVCSENGPLQIITQHDFIDHNIFDTAAGDTIIHRLTGERVRVGAFVKLRVITHKFLKYDTSIKILARLEDLATPKEIESGYYDPQEDDVVRSTLHNKLMLLKGNAPPAFG